MVLAVWAARVINVARWQAYWSRSGFERVRTSDDALGSDEFDTVELRGQFSGYFDGARFGRCSDEAGLNCGALKARGPEE